MMRNFLCSAFLTSALAANPQIVADPSLRTKFLEKLQNAEIACRALTLDKSDEESEDFYNDANILDNCENIDMSGFMSHGLGSCQKNIEDLLNMSKQLKGSADDDDVNNGIRKVELISEKCSQYVDIVVELSSSKSRIYKIESDIEAKDVTVEGMGGKVKTKVDTDMDGNLDLKKGLGGACNTKDDQKWSTDEKCQKHIDDIKTELGKLIDQGYKFRSLRFLATAGLRQSEQKLDTFDKLKKTIESEIKLRMPKNSRAIEYRPLSGEEEAENEFLATMMLLRKSNDAKDTMTATQPLGIMGFGGGSLQYGMLTPTEAMKSQDKKTIKIESAQGGLDKVFVDVNSEADACQIEYGSDEDMSESGYTTSASKYEACKTKISETFSMTTLFPKKATVQELWAREELPLYVTGGINWAIKGHFSKDDDNVKKDEDGNIVLDKRGNRILIKWDYNRVELEQAAIEECKPYVFDNHDGYARQVCTKYAYLVHVLTEFGIPETKEIRFRQTFPAVVGPEAQWIRSAVMKQKFPDNDMLQPFDTKTITHDQEKAWEKEQATWEEEKAKASAERLI